MSVAVRSSGRLPSRSGDARGPSPTPRVLDRRAGAAGPRAGRLGASPTIIGLLFASFGVTLLGVSVPMGAVSDRIGRRLPLVAGWPALAASTLLFAYADTPAVAVRGATGAGRGGRRHLGRRLRAHRRSLRRRTSAVG